jgi:hypothetical protein
MAVGKLLRLMQNLHQSTWGRKMYADRPSKDEQLLINFCEKPKKKNTKAEGICGLEFIFCFIETVYEPLHLDK